MTKPNFFILGAPKCGTTSLAAWLSEHPQVFMSPRKEPHFFNSDDNYSGVSSLKDYEQLFAGATASHKAIGEASVWYLHSKSAVPNIEDYSSNSRYIVCLRNPIDMVYSLHEQQVVNGWENVTKFDRAWDLNAERSAGRSVPSWCLEPRHLDYGEACKLGDQFERLSHHVDEDRVLTILLDDVKQNPGREFRRAQAFLGVEDDRRQEFPVLNMAKERRSGLIKKAVMTAGLIKGRLGIHRHFGILSGLDRANLRFRQRDPMSAAMRQQLIEYFQSDIKKLSEIVNRDLSHWMQT